MDIDKILQFISSFLGKNAADFLSAVDEDTVAPIAAILNVAPDTLFTLIKVVPLLLSGDIDVKNSLPALIPAFIGYFLSLYAPDKNANETAADNKSAADENVVRENLDIIKSGYSCFDIYLQSESASE